MLTFLESVSSYVYALFGYMWAAIYWYYSQAYSKLVIYVNVWWNAINTYYASYQYALGYYVSALQDKVKHFLFNNAVKLQFVAIDSYNAIQEYRYIVLPTLKDFIYNQLPQIKNVLVKAASQITTLASYSVGVISLVFSSGYNELITYVNTVKPKLFELFPHITDVVSLVIGTTFTRLIEFVGVMYSVLKAFIESYYGYLVQLWTLRTKILSLVVDSFFNKLSTLVNIDFTNLLNLGRYATQLLTLVSATTFARLIYLTSEKFGRLVDLIESPQINVLGLIDKTFLPWFLNKVSDWFFSG